MTSAIVQQVSLRCHSSTAGTPVDIIEVNVQWSAPRLRLSYRVLGAVSSLRIPRLATPERRDELWRHTCAELFVAQPHTQPYYEFNFSPASAWAAYRFQSYRAGMQALPLTAPHIVVTATANELTLNVDLDMSALVTPKTNLSLALCMVIEDAAGNLSYWALQHPTGKPDFHHADGFALKL